MYDILLGLFLNTSKPFSFFLGLHIFTIHFNMVLGLVTDNLFHLGVKFVSYPKQESYRKVFETTLSDRNVSVQKKIIFFLAS
jgi:hypothetical protein